MRLGFLSKFLRQQQGATIIEFALVAPVFFLLMFAILEYGLYTFHRVMLDSIVMQASRAASLGSPPPGSVCSGSAAPADYFECFVRARASSSNLFRSSRLLIQLKPMDNEPIGTPDICIHDGEPSIEVTSCDKPDNWIDSNGNGVQDFPGTAGATQNGNGGVIMEGRVSYPWQVLIPVIQPFFGTASNGDQPGVVLLTANAVFKNEPFPQKYK